MKKVYLIINVMLLLGILTFSCKKEYTPEDVVDDQIKLNEQALKDSLLRDSLRRTSGVIHYSINIVDGSDAVFSVFWGSSNKKSAKKAAAIKNVKVTAVQYGKTFVVTDTLGLGIVTIKDLRVGSVSVRVESTGFTECSFIAQLTPITGRDTVLYNTTRSDLWNLERYVATMIPLFPTTGDKMATVSGVVTYESDLTNNLPEKAANVDVFGVIDTDEEEFIARYLWPSNLIYDYYTDEFSVEPTYGQILKIAYNSAVFSGRTDANGAYTIKVPATASGLPIRMEISDVAVEQKLLMNTSGGVPVFGEQNVRTLFSSNYTPSDVPLVAPAYCLFDAPTGSGTSNQPATEAQATAVVSESGIIAITLSNPGLGYTQDPKVVITGVGAINPAAASVTRASDGRLSDIRVDVPGLGYTSANVSITGSETKQATASAVISYSVDRIELSNRGQYTSAIAPSVTIYSNSGSGATATANMSGFVGQINIANGGTGYTAAPLVVISGGNSKIPATATAAVAGGIVTSINITNAGSGYTSAPTISIQSANGAGTGASATAVVTYEVSSVTVNNAGSGYLAGDAKVVFGTGTVQAIGTVSLGKGVLTAINVTDPGAGFTAAPNVVITGGDASVNATATATVANGQVTGFTITNAGTGYTSAPTVTVSTFLKAATATALCNSMAGKIIALNLTNAGEGYSEAPVIEFYYPSANGTTQGNGNGTKAIATATVSNGRVTDLTITDGGTGYFTAPLVRFRMPNVNQTAQATLTISNDGYVTGITLNNGGWGYTTTPNITINASVTGKGTGAMAIVTAMDNSKITGIKIVNQGSGYTGKNYPVSSKPFSMITAGGASSTSINDFNALTAKTYIRDIYLGTGKRTIED